MIRHDAVRNQSHRVAVQTVSERDEKGAVIRRPEKEGRSASRVVDGVKEVGIGGRPRGLRHEVASLFSKCATRPSKVDAHARWACVFRTVAEG